jgi:hypothetical protein
MTTTASETLQTILNKGDPALVGTAAAKMKLGTMMTPLKRTFTGLAAAAAFDLTAIDGTGETGGSSNANRLAVLAPKTLRVTASGTANSVGSYATTDASGATVSPTAGANVGLALLSDDGKTVTFPTTVTAFIIEYVPRSAIDMTAHDAALLGAP